MDSHPDLYILNLQEDFYSVCVYGPVVDCGSPDQLVIGTCCHLMFCRIFDFCNMVKMTYFRLVWKLSYVTFLPQHRTFILVWVLHESSLDTYFVANRGHHRLISMNAIAINVRLQAQVSSMEGIHFWPHRGFWENLDFLCDDEVHLRCPPASPYVVTSSPMHRFWRYIRSAISQHMHILCQ